MNNLSFPFSKEISLENIRFILIAIFVFTLPFDRFYTTLIIYVLILMTLIDFNYNKLKHIPKQIWIFQLLYLLSIVGYFYSENKLEAGFMLEKQSMILLLPFLLPLAIDITKKRIDYLLSTLTISCILTIIGLLCYSIYSIITLNQPIKVLFTSPFFYNHYFTEPIGIHAGYFSMYASLAIFFILQKIATSKKDVKQIVILLIGILILLIGTVFLSSRSNTITILLIFTFIYPFFYIKNRKYYLLLIFSVFAVVFLLFKNVDYIHKRFSTELIGDINLNNTSMVEPRVERWKLAGELIKESPIYGHGTGDEVSLLKKKYWEKGLINSYYNSYNVHNQYLSILIKHGIIGLIIFGCAFYYYLKIAISTRNFIYIAFLLQLLIGFATENILDANKGIFYFALFNTLLGYHNLKLFSLKNKSLHHE